MALLINQASPAGSDSPTLGDDQIRAFKLAVQDIFGLPDNTTITNALMAANSTGLQYVKFNDQSGSPASSGRLAQNSTNLEFHDGTAARIIANATNTLTMSAKTLSAPTLTGAITISGAMTTSATGPALVLSATDAQIRIGGLEDPGWSIPALWAGSASGRGLAFVNIGSAEGGLLVNAYYDGAWKRVTANTVQSLYFDGSTSTIYVRNAVTSTAGSAITWVDHTTFTSGGGIQVGSPTGGDKGAGTINCVAIYDDNVGPLTDWVFDLYYDGRARPDDPAYRGGRLYPFAETQTITAAERRLPWMPTRADFEHRRALGSMVASLWFGQEQQQLYLFDLERRVQALEAR